MRRGKHRRGLPDRNGARRVEFPRVVGRGVDVATARKKCRRLPPPRRKRIRRSASTRDRGAGRAATGGRGPGSVHRQPPAGAAFRRSQARRALRRESDGGDRFRFGARAHHLPPAQNGGNSSCVSHPLCPYGKRRPPLFPRSQCVKFRLRLKWLAKKRPCEKDVFFVLNFGGASLGILSGIEMGLLWDF